MKPKGFTLIELAVVLAVIAVLAAVLTPLVTSYIDQARETRAASDTRTIAETILLYKRDTGQFPIYDNATAANNDVQTAETLQGAGTDLAAATGVGWTSAILTSNASLEDFLNINKLSLATGNPKGGAVAYRGPYLGTIGSDPYGNRYLVTADNMRRASLNFAYVISAGPNGTLETTHDQARSGAFTVGGDDIVSRIR